MKPEDFVKITPEMIEFCKELKSNGGVCKEKCYKFPFDYINTPSFSNCIEKYSTVGMQTIQKDKRLKKSAKKFLKMVEKSVEKCETMKLSDYLEMQAKLDNYIIENNYDKRNETSEAPKVLLTDTILACMVELGEYANETRCFKHWSKKEASEKEVRLEEYVDVLHFIFSIANQEKFTAEDIEKAYKSKYDENIRRQKEGY